MMVDKLRHLGKTVSLAPVFVIFERKLAPRYFIVYSRPRVAQFIKKAFNTFMHIKVKQTRKHSLIYLVKPGLVPV